LYSEGVSLQDGRRLVKRRRALLESNPPRNSQLETHRDDEAGAVVTCREAAAPAKIPPAVHPASNGVPPPKDQEFVSRRFPSPTMSAVCRPAQLSESLIGRFNARNPVAAARFRAGKNYSASGVLV